MSQPPLLFDQPALQMRRARAARQFAARPAAAPDFLLRRVAEDFSERLHVIRRTFADAIDLGCHHGLLGRKLAAEHAPLSILSADACEDMLRLAADQRVRVDLERLPFAPESADLIVSGLALQSVNDLPGAMAHIRATLRPDGLFLGALLGGQTLVELREAFLVAETELDHGVSPHIAPAIDVRDLGTLLQRAGFALPVVDSDVVSVTYAHPLALLHDLRAMGATNVLSERCRTFLRRDVLARAMAIYQARFANADGRVRATFEILTATAWAPHGSQQKPLKRGSATTRLEDALKAKAP